MGARQWLLIILLGAIWGASFFFNAIALKDLPALTIVALRLAGGATFLWIALLVVGLRLPRGGRQWRDIIVMCVINNIVPFMLIIWGQRDIASGVAAILNATMPFFAIMVAHFLTRDEPLVGNQLAGVAVALSGIGCMVGLDAVAGLGRNVVGEFSVLGAALCYGFASVWGRRLAHHPPLAVSAAQTLCSSAVMLPLALAVDGLQPLMAASADSLIAIAALGLLCTAIAYVLFFAILRSSGRRQCQPGYADRAGQCYSARHVGAGRTAPAAPYIRHGRRGARSGADRRPADPPAVSGTLLRRTRYGTEA